MPELIEVERYRRLAESALGRPIVAVDAPDAWFLKRGLDSATLTEVAIGQAFVVAGRIGKLLLMDLDGGETIGVRFGMTGRLLVDGRSGIDDLTYGSSRDEPRWDRVGFVFADGGSMVVRDPRRLGGIELDPDVGRLGVDATTITAAELARVLSGSSAPLKARLLDQARIAGVGNLIADETLWRAGLDPGRPAASLSPTEVRRLHRWLGQTVAALTDAGGSHMGRLQDERHQGGRCPRCSTLLVRRTVGGRRTYSCPRHQR